MKENFRHPRHHDEDEDKNIIAFQSPADRFEPADLERRQNQIFTNQLLPFALKQIAVFHHHRDEKMRLEHADSGAKRVVETITPRLDPKHHPDDRKIEKEDQERY